LAIQIRITFIVFRKNLVELYKTKTATATLMEIVPLIDTTGTISLATTHAAHVFAPFL